MFCFSQVILIHCQGEKLLSVGSVTPAGLIRVVRDGIFVLRPIQVERKRFFRGEILRQDLIRLTDHLPVKALYCARVRGTTESLPWRTRGESANNLSSLICAKDVGFASAFPALIVTTGFLELEALTDTTLAVPTAHLWSPVS